MRTQTLAYRAGDIDAVGYFACPDGPGPFAAVLVAHEGPGLDVHARRRTEMLAKLGYAAFAADLHGNGHVARSHEEVMTLVSALRDRRDILRVRIGAALDVLRSREEADPSRVAAIGYCFGGMTVLELARSGADIKGVITFHGLLDAVRPDEAGRIKASVLVLTGAADHLVPDAQVAAFEAEMTDANIDWQVVKFGGVRHAFTNFVEAGALEKLGFGYDEHADKRSWAMMRNFLEEIL